MIRTHAWCISLVVLNSVLMSERLSGWETFVDKLEEFSNYVGLLRLQGGLPLLFKDLSVGSLFSVCSPQIEL